MMGSFWIAGAILALIGATILEKKIRFYVSVFVGLAAHYLRGLAARYLSVGVVEMNTQYFDISYYMGPARYIVRIPHRRRGPSRFLIILDGDNNDVTEEIHRFLGPHHDFHGIPNITPKLLGHTKLQFDTISNATFVFGENDPITFA